MVSRYNFCMQKWVFNDFTFKVREGGGQLNYPKLCVFLNNSAIIEHIQTYYTSN